MAKASKAKKSSKSSGGHEAQVTTDHEEIRRWVEERGGTPAVVKGTESGDSALLRIDYPGFSGEANSNRSSGRSSSRSSTRTISRFFIRTRQRTAARAAFRSSSLATRAKSKCSVIYVSLLLLAACPASSAGRLTLTYIRCAPEGPRLRQQTARYKTASQVTN